MIHSSNPKNYRPIIRRQREENLHLPLIALTFSALLLASSPKAIGQCQYDVTVLPCLVDSQGYRWCGTATGMNNVGQIVGIISIGEGALGFVWSQAEGLQFLPTPPGVYAVQPRDINDAGLIVGEFNSPGSAFLWDGASYTELGIPPGGTFSNAFGINEEGVIVGIWGNNVTGPGRVAFIWQDGVMTSLGPLFGGDSDSNDANSINNVGQVVGRWSNDFHHDSRAYRYENGEILTLPAIPGGFTSDGRAVNESGAICGNGRVPHPTIASGARRGFVWSNGSFFVAPPLGDQRHSTFTDINDYGQAVGYADGFVSFLFQDETLYDFVAIAPDYVTRYAWHVDRFGRITAEVRNSEVGRRIALLTPRAPLGDLNADCRVDLQDMLYVLLSYGCSGPQCLGDVDRSNRVGLLDLALVLAGWSE